MFDSITAVFPAYNDEHSIEQVVKRAATELRSITKDFEIVVVNDGSRDGTAPVLARMESQIPELRVIHHPQNRGYGAAITTGFGHATKTWVFYTDGDGQYDVREIHKLLSAMRPDLDLVNGYKICRQDPWYRVWIGEAYRCVMRFLFKLPIRDVDCDFRLFRRRILEAVALESDSGAFCVEMIRKFHLAGASMTEVPVTHLPRQFGQSQFFCFRHLLRVVPGILRVWWQLVLLPMLGTARIATSLPRRRQGEREN